jgi:hypothetical protein
MNELTELPFDEHDIYLKDNLVKGAILPEKAAELNRTITIEGDTLIEGAVYARRLEIKQGETEIRGAVFTQSELVVDSDAAGAVSFKKSVGSALSVRSRAANCTLTFYSDINAQSVTLCNAFVAGSIYADDIILENCVVIGGVFATQTIELTNCIAGTFNTPSVRIAGTIALLLPSAFSIERITAAPGSQFYNLCLADLGSLYKGMPQTPDSGRIEINIETDEIQTILKNDAMQKTLRSYTVIGKVLAADLLDTNKFQNHFLLTAAALGSQLLKTYNIGVDEKGEDVPLSFERIRAFFFDLLHGGIAIQDLDSSFDISRITGKG